MRLIRSRAAEWSLDTNRIGAMGFSAGGEVVAMLVYSPTIGDTNSADPIDRMRQVNRTKIRRRAVKTPAQLWIGDRNFWLNHISGFARAEQGWIYSASVSLAPRVSLRATRTRRCC